MTNGEIVKLVDERNELRKTLRSAIIMLCKNCPHCESERYDYECSNRLGKCQTQKWHEAAGMNGVVIK